MHTANVTLDMKGLTCPGPLLGAKRMVDELDNGQVMLLISDCPGTRDDLYAWARQTGNEVLQTEKLAEGGTGYYIRKGTAAACKANVTLDMRGVVCPGPIVEAKKLIGGMQSGEVLKLISNCPGTQADIAGWTAATNLALEAMAQIAAGEFEFYIRKR